MKLVLEMLCFVTARGCLSDGTPYPKTDVSRIVVKAKQRNQQFFMLVIVKS
jgi:hypothetical protein